MKESKCLLDFVDQRHGMGEALDYENGILYVYDSGDYSKFPITDEQLKQLEENPSIKLALSFKQSKDNNNG